eukprot:5529310-Karenia_brevis.AAC.1
MATLLSTQAHHGPHNVEGHQGALTHCHWSPAGDPSEGTNGRRHIVLDVNYMGILKGLSLIHI